jgi:hypothetical protein
MFTNGKDWSNAELKTYAGLLGVSAQNVLLKVFHLTKKRRASYFESDGDNGNDIFVDPDIGIAPATGKPDMTHVSRQELQGLVRGNNVVAVYQHRPQSSKSVGWLCGYMRSVRKINFKIVGYEAAQVGMIFITQSHDRNRRLLALLAKRLGVTAKRSGLFPGRLVY